MGTAHELMRGTKLLGQSERSARRPRRVLPVVSHQCAQSSAPLMDNDAANVDDFDNFANTATTQYTPDREQQAR